MTTAIGGSSPSFPSRPPAFVVDDLAELARARRLLEEEIPRQVRRLRLLAVPWRQIGSALAMSKTTLHRRFSWVDTLPVAVCRDPQTGAGYFQCPRTGLVWRGLDDLGRGIDVLTQLRVLRARTAALPAAAYADGHRVVDA